jgi:hypothetical protein
MKKAIEVNVVAFQEGDLWVAQCVEYDIAAFAKTITALPRAFERAVAANLCANADLGRSAFEGIPKPPEHFRQLFEDAQLHLEATKTSPKRSTPVKVRDLRIAEAA